MRAILELPLLGLWLVTLPACAYQQAMREGDEAAAAGDWPAAYVAYTHAGTLKKKAPEADAAATAARDEASEEALEQARRALEAGDYPTTVERLAYVESIDTDHPEVYDLRMAARQAITTKLLDRWKAGQIREAYTLAVQQRQLFPDTADLGATFDGLRAFVRDRSDAQLAEEKFPEAIQTLGIIREFEPDQAPLVTTAVNKVLLAWADHTSALGQAQLKARRHGAAAVLFARAHEIGGRPGDLDAMRKIAADLALAGTMGLDVKASGEPRRASALESAIEAEVLSLADVRAAEARPTLKASVVARARACTEKSASTSESKDYVSGRIQVPNPARVELDAQLEQVRAAEATAKADAEKMWPALEAAEKNQKQLQDRLKEAESAIAEAEAQLGRASDQLEGSQRRRDELSARLDALRASGGSADAVADLGEQLAEAGKLIAEWSGEVLTAEKAVQAAESKAQATTREMEPTGESLGALREAYEALTTARTRSQQEAAKLAGEVYSTPEQIWEDVHDRFEYAVTTWTRVCVAPVSVSMAPRWQTTLEVTREYAPEVEVKDTANPGHDGAGVAEDPKAYPQTDDELKSTLDAETARDVTAWIAKLVDDHYARRIDEVTASLSGDPLTSTTGVVELLLGAPKHLDDTTRSMFAAHLREHFGLEKPGLLEGAR